MPLRALAVAAPISALSTAGFLAAGASPPRETPAAPTPVAARSFASPLPVSPAIVIAATSFPLDEDSSFDEAAITWSRRLPDEALGCDPACATGDLRFGGVRVPRAVAATIVDAARRTGVEPSLLMAIAEKESSFAPRSSASTSSARGLFQFIDRTWLRAVRTFGPRHGLESEAAEIVGPEENPRVADLDERERILALRDDPRLSSLLAGELLSRDAGELERRLGRPLTAGEAYLIHFLGPDDAGAFIARVERNPRDAAARLLPRPARANRSLFYAWAGRRSRPLSVAAVHAEFEKMMTTRVERYASVSESGDAVAR